MATASAVSRYLGQTFTRAESWTTRVKGWHNYSSGFEVRMIGYGENRGKVQVGHSLGDHGHRMTPEQRAPKIRSMISEYRQTLEVRYSVEVIAGGTQLIVSDKGKS